MTIRVYNTLSKQKEPFETVVPGKVGIYLCGPTVYKESHIGHMVGPVIFDTIKRYLAYSGYEVNWVVNITDVDDKLIGQMHERGIPMSEIAEEMTIDYLNNLRALGVDQIDHMPKATEHMDGIIKFTQSLIDKGFAYASRRRRVFRRDQGSRLRQAQQPPGRRAAGRRGRAHASQETQSPATLRCGNRPSRASPPGTAPGDKGRPGWHIECSAMSGRFWARRSTSTAAGSIWCSRTMKTNWPKASAATASRW